MDRPSGAASTPPGRCRARWRQHNARHSNIGIVHSKAQAHVQRSPLGSVLRRSWPRLLYNISVLHQLLVQLADLLIHPAHLITVLLGTDGQATLSSRKAASVQDASTLQAQFSKRLAIDEIRRAHVSPRVVRRPEASSIVGGGGFSFFVPKIRRIAADLSTQNVPWPAACALSSAATVTWLLCALATHERECCNPLKGRKL